LLDLVMPVMSGYDLLHACAGRKWTLPEVIVVTASIMDRDKQQCKDLGVRWFINKPIQIHTLKDILRHITRGKHV